MNKFNSIIKFYKFAVIITFNALLILILFNLILAGLGMRSIDKRILDYSKTFPDIEAYRISAPEARSYLKEQDIMRSIPLEYEPWVQFRNPEFHSKHINTDPKGFRKTKEPKHQSDKYVKVYVFGGSTTFGYGISDNDTIPSYMQKILEEQYPNKSVLVKNFGQTCYYSSQELLLLISLIKNNDIPDWAVFIDGLNDTNQLSRLRDEPWLTNQIKNRLDSGIDFSWIPMVRFVKAKFPEKIPKLSIREEDTQRIVDYVLSRYKKNLEMIQSICRLYGIKFIFVWQPVPFYKYKKPFHKKFPHEIDGPHWEKVYSSVADYMHNENFLDLADIFAQTQGKVYVDDVHYNEYANEKIASKICAALEFN